jgi:hypothetical protein
MLTEQVPQMHWETPEMRWKWVERTMYELGCLVKGQIPIQAERVAALVEEIDALRKELTATREKLDKVAEYVKSHLKPNGGK